MNEKRTPTTPSYHGKGWRVIIKSSRGKNEGWCLYDTYFIPSSRIIHVRRYNPPTRVGRKMGVSLHHKKGVGETLLRFHLLLLFWKLENKRKRVWRGQKKKKKKSSRGNEKNEALVHWKKEGKTFSPLQEEIRIHAIREVKKIIIIIFGEQKPD